MADFSGSGFGDGGSDDPQPVSFEGYIELTIDPSDNTTGDLEISLKNTSPENNQGWITSLAFMLPDGILADGNYFTDSGLKNFLNSPVKAPPFTTSGGLTYNAGAGTKNSWVGGGKPQKGIGTDKSAKFNFGISSTNEITNFTDMLVSNKNFIAVRFQGFTDGSSAKIGGSGGGGAQVPEPATIFLLGSGLLGLFGYRKKFWKPKK